jgi:hypothetical protein
MLFEFARANLNRSADADKTNKVKFACLPTKAGK